MTLRSVLHELWSRNKAMELDCRGWGVKGCIKQLESMGLDPMPVHLRSLVTKNYGRKESYGYIVLANEGNESKDWWSPSVDYYFRFDEFWKMIKKYLNELEYEHIWVIFGGTEGHKEQDRYKMVVKGKIFNGRTREWEDGKTWEDWEKEWKETS